MVEHYIEVTAIIGPIDEPHVLHTFDPDGTVRMTAHGDLAERLFNAIYKVDHDADVSAHVTTEDRMLSGPGLLRDALASVTDERDELRDVVVNRFLVSERGQRECETERDWLRAVVDIVRETFDRTPNRWTISTAGLEALDRALTELDGSEADDG